MYVSFVGMARSTKSHTALTTIFTTHNLSSPDTSCQFTMNPLTKLFSLQHANTGVQVQGQILDSKEFYSPLITPYEAQLAFAPEGGLISNDYSLDFDALLSSTAELSVSEQGDHCLNKMQRFHCISSRPLSMRRVPLWSYTVVAEAEGIRGLPMT